MPKENQMDRKKSLGIYVHIPFCLKKCDYCDFLSQVGNVALQQQYCQKLLKEIESTSVWTGGYQVDTVFIGGGTPSILEAEWIDRILEAINKNFCMLSEQTSEEIEMRTKAGKETVEITLECNPGTLNEEKVRAYKQAGVNRISLGLQSANNEELKRLGRIHTWEQFLESAELVRHYFTNWNVDLMSALPGQSVESYQYTLDSVLRLEPPHISAYSLIIEEGTPFYERYQGEEELRQKGEKPRILPDEETERRMYELTGERLEAQGYQRYEISNYARVGYECRHNNRYWKRMDYIGLGLGASSCLENVRFQNVSDMTEYLKKEATASKVEVQHLTLQEQMEEMMFLGLRRMEGVNQEEFYRMFQKTVEDVFGEVIPMLELQELIKHSGNYIQLTQKGIDLSNYVLAQFLLESV